LQRACQNPGARIKNRENRFLALKMVGIGLIDGVVFADPTGSGPVDLARRGTARAFHENFSASTRWATISDSVIREAADRAGSGLSLWAKDFSGPVMLNNFHEMSGRGGRSRSRGAAGNPCAGPRRGVDRTCWTSGARTATAIMDRATEAEKGFYLSSRVCPVRIASISIFPVIASFPSRPFLCAMMIACSSSRVRGGRTS
jgi:hypothetical protein